jgi:hypothetical protein
MAFSKVGLAKELDKQGYELLSYSRKDDHQLEVQANKLHPVLLQEGDEVYIPVPVNIDLQLDDNYSVKAIHHKDSEQEALVHAAHFVKNLIDNGQVNGIYGQSAPNTSHKIEVNEKGQRIIKRQGFSIL